jgi:ParB family transcriptional regulator, chromosome partitioning protein
MTTPRLELLHPSQLTTDKNVRKDLRLTKDFVASIAAEGVLQPIIAFPDPTDPDRYRIHMGHRRTAAAQEAGLDQVPVVIVDERDAASTVAHQMVENLHREQLSRLEEAGGYKELALIGVPVDEIARRTSRDKTTVESAIAVASNETATAVLEQADITLDQAAAIVEFTDDRRAVKKLTDVAANNPSRFNYEVEDLRRKRRQDEAYAAKKAQMKKKGVTVVNDNALPYHVALNLKGIRLTRLDDGTGTNTAMSARKHAKCPGHAVALVRSYYGDTVDVAYGCTDWREHGHQELSGRQETPEERAVREESERIHQQAAAEKEIAAKLRADFLTELLQRKDLAKLPNTAALFAETLAGHMYQYSSSYYHALEPQATIALRLLGITDLGELRSYARLQQEITPGRELQVALAAALALAEWFVDRVASSRGAAPYFELLQSWGYTLNPHETDAIRDATATAETKDADK